MSNEATSNEWVPAVSLLIARCSLLIAPSDQRRLRHQPQVLVDLALVGVDCDRLRSRRSSPGGPVALGLEQGVDEGHGARRPTAPSTSGRAPVRMHSANSWYSSARSLRSVVGEVEAVGPGALAAEERRPRPGRACSSARTPGCARRSMSVPSSRTRRIGRPLRSPGAVIEPVRAEDHAVAEAAGHDRRSGRSTGRARRSRS